MPRAGLNSLPRPARSALNQEVRQGSCEWLRHSWDAGSESSLVTLFAFAVCEECRQQNLWTIKKNTTPGGVFLRAPRRSPSCQPAAGGYRSRQPGHFLESASLHPPQAALRRFPRRPLQVKELRFSNNFVEKRSSSYLQSLDLSRFCR